jgi:DNA-binding transcriptional regulator GbsR (MarR family)
VPDAYESARDEFIGTLERIAASLGAPDATRRILGLLIFTPRAVSLDEISERLHLAKSGVSVNIRALENANLVRKVWVKGNRRDFYRADLSFAQLYRNSFEKAVAVGMRPLFAVMEKCVAALREGDVAPENEADAEAARRRLERELRMKDPLIELFERFAAALGELNTLGEGGPR